MYQLYRIGDENLPDFKYRREPNVKVKSAAKNLSDLMFKKSFTNDKICFYYGKSSISVINLETQSCSCRFFLAYSNCAHVYKAILIFDIQTPSSKFIVRPRKGPKSKTKIEPDVDVALAKESFMTNSQLDIFLSLVASYNNINNLLFQFEIIYYSPLKVEDKILKTMPDNQVIENPTSKVPEKNVSRGRGRPRIQKGALKH
ncbi:unnamed protein product [Brachionus calyciflorus]|uniref:SWIM-type domain-containing protein n=1 Tax=Brachionus calyciflorus TaxID=104777 RepID=A0A814Q8P3_9BILA|nr:unnamed protein product [Brachionus calyciflorus]